MRPLAPALLVLLAACGARDNGEAAEPQADAAAMQLPRDLSAEQRAQLENRDCRTVAEAYAAALGQRAFDFAALFWTGGEIDGNLLEALYDSYSMPELIVAEVHEEASAGVAHCTITGALGDAAAPSRPLREGQIVLRRARGARAAAPAVEERWTIRSSTFIEPMERSGEGAPA